ncbi:zonular occludens toxin domain-containing protein [Roseateles sp. BYS78W]|uniref:Zonular occludens toxin domain-containing protein n=1 Tax=Pelomonas candidula TaxID=3299025 RepID=A0ABW7H5N7_9BURK
MPITLVTGLPGHGKTLYTLARWKAEAEKAGRPVFHNSIPGLQIPGWQPFEVKDWEQLPAGALLIVDEAQFAFPVTGRGQTPPWVQQLATHRHKGLDFIVITQNPMLLDSFVRKLVDRHFHVVRKFGTHFATIYEYVNGVKEDVSKNRGDGIRHEFRYPKDVFTWYKSAELHTVKRRIPARVYLLLVLPVIFGILCWIGYHRMSPEFAAEQARKSTPEATAPPAQVAEGPVGRARSGAGDRGGQMTPAEYAAAYTPRIEGLPHTAPIYDGVTQPQQAPYPAACIANAKRCQCYSQQGTRLDMNEQLCRQLADGGFFVAWTPAGERVQRAQDQTRQRELQSGQEQPAYTPTNAPPPQFVAQAIDQDAGSLPRRVARIAR